MLYVSNKNYFYSLNTHFMKLKITLLISILFIYAGFAQVTNQGKPFSWKLRNQQTIAPIAMPSFNLKDLQREDAINDTGKDKPWRYGYEFMVDYSLANSGSWQTLPNGGRIWRIRFISAGAKTMNFLFSDFYMPQGATLYLYNNDHTDLLGAYDARQNNTERVLGTWLVKGEDIWIEYYEPAEKAGQGKLEIFKVVHGYRTQDDGYEKDPDDDLNSSGACNYDVDCFMADINGFKDINKKAVALIIVGNNSFCSGSLVNNTANDGMPYFLTANHCYSNPAQWSFRFNWISPNPVCASTENSTTNAPNYYQTMSGATLKARRTESDFCLVEITTDIPANWDLTFGGWDRATTAPTSSFGIHHPSGDIMKACRDFDSPTQEDYKWRVENWDLGVTEGGSSGSPLYDSNGRLRGQLHGGSSGCAGTVDNNGYDEYGRFDVSWDAGASPSARLKEWLDPANTGAMTLDYYPPQQIYSTDAQITIVQTGIAACATTFAPQIHIVNKGTQNLVSAQINYQLNGSALTSINWTGNLATGNSATVTLPALTAITGANVFTATLTQPNDVADEDPVDNTTTSNFNVLVYPVTNVTLTLVTDNYGDETSWQFTDASGTVLYSGGDYGNNQTTTQTFTLTNEGCYTFTISDEYGDGMCCEWGTGSYTLTTADGTTIAQGGDFGDTDVVNFALAAPLSSGSYALQQGMGIYPNPSSGVFNVTVPLGYDPHYKVYNLLGQEVTTGSISGGNGSINLGNAATGVYLLKVNDTASGATATFKLVKQ